jgi:hypothetical protein
MIPHLLCLQIYTIFFLNNLGKTVFFANRAPGWILSPVENIFSNNTCVGDLLTTPAEVKVGYYLDLCKGKHRAYCSLCDLAPVKEISKGKTMGSR